MDKISPSSIELVHATGLTGSAGGHQGVIAGTTAKPADYDEASAVLRDWWVTNPEGSQEKVDWKIVFADGFEFGGTTKIGRSPSETTSAPDFVGVVTSGLFRLVSDDPQDAGFRRFVDKDGSRRAQALAILQRYDLGLTYPSDDADLTSAPRR